MATVVGVALVGPARQLTVWTGKNAIIWLPFLCDIFNGFEGVVNFSQNFCDVHLGKICRTLIRLCKDLRQFEHEKHSSVWNAGYVSSYAFCPSFQVKAKKISPDFVSFLQVLPNS